MNFTTAKNVLQNYLCPYYCPSEYGALIYGIFQKEDQLICRRITIPAQGRLVNYVE
jgi:hypothetical protein